MTTRTLQLEGRVAGAPIGGPSRLQIDFSPSEIPARLVPTSDTPDVEFA